MLALVRTADAGVYVKGVLGVKMGVRRGAVLLRLVGVFNCCSIQENRTHPEILS